MGHSVALRSSAAGIPIGGLIAGSVWWLDGPVVLIATVGAVWAAALSLTLYVTQSHATHGNAGPWGAVIGGSLLFGVALDLSAISVSNGATAALTLLAIGFTLLGYAAGMATAYRQERARRTAGEPATDR